MTMFLPKHHLSQEDLINQCDDLRMKYKNIVSRLPKKMRKKCKFSKFVDRQMSARNIVEIANSDFDDIKKMMFHGGI